MNNKVNSMSTTGGVLNLLNFSNFLNYNIKVRHIRNSKLFTDFLYVFLMQKIVRKFIINL